jgi:hypothetical protein
MLWITQIGAITVPLDEWRADRQLRLASAAACDKYKTDRQIKPLAECAATFLETPVLAPLSRSLLYAECQRALTRRDVYLRPLHYLGWSAGILLNGPRCAIDQCELPPTCLDHDHLGAGGTGNVRGLLCSVHNQRYLAPSGPNAARNTFSPDMASYLSSPPLAHLEFTYVSTTGYPDGWSAASANPVAGNRASLRQR